MPSKNKIEKWLLADWSTSRNSNSGSKFNEDMKNLAISTDRNESGKELDRKDQNYEVCQVVKARRSIASNGNNDSGAGGSLPNEDHDFSPSASSWEPSGESSSDESEEDNKNNSNGIQQYVRQIIVKKRNSKKTLTPVHRPNAVVNVLQERQINGSRDANNSRKRKHKGVIKENAKKFLPDSTRYKNTTLNSLNNDNETVNVKLQNILEINATFQQLFAMLYELKPHNQISHTTFINNIEELKEKSFEDLPQSPRSEESNRSHDNLLITNKYSTVRSLSSNEQGQDKLEDEWIPIGSGKTLIHKDKYRKVNWKSYTIATRTLLLATFPRRILATHSLTGKRSPAFQNKPAKMCLDPKIVSDVLIEITSRFKVKENLVRSIITTKCADEAKMYKMRLKSKNKTPNLAPHESSSDRENVPLQNLKKESRIENKN